MDTAAAMCTVPFATPTCESSARVLGRWLWHSTPELFEHLSGPNERVVQMLEPDDATQVESDRMKHLIVKRRVFIIRGR